MSDDEAPGSGGAGRGAAASGQPFTPRDEIGGLEQRERHILECLGAAVVGV